MAESIRLDGLDFVYIQVKFGRFRRYVLGNFAQLSPAATNYGACARAFWRAVILSETSLVIQLAAAEFKRRHILKWDVLDAGRTGATRRART